jgi:predicted ATPase
MLRGEITNDRGSDVATAMAEQLLALVTEQCAMRPTVLVIDDLQWADPASVTLWGRLARMASHMRLLLIATMCPVHQREDLLRVRRVLGDETRFPLSPLGEMAVADLVAALPAASPTTICSG